MFFLVASVSVVHLIVNHPLWFVAFNLLIRRRLLRLQLTLHRCWSMV